jgi:hypothetical protein
MAKKCPKYTVGAGRQILRDGKPFISVSRDADARPVDADQATRKIAALFNKACFSGRWRYRK